MKNKVIVIGLIFSALIIVGLGYKVIKHQIDAASDQAAIKQQAEENRKAGQAVFDKYLKEQASKKK